MKKALIVVDFQNDFIDGALGFEKAQRLKERILGLVSGFDGDVIFTFDTHESDYLSTKEGENLPISHCIKGTKGWEMPREFAPFLQKAVKFELNLGSKNQNLSGNSSGIQANLGFKDENLSENLGSEIYANLGFENQNSSGNSSKIQTNLSENSGFKNENSSEIQVNLGENSGLKNENLSLKNSNSKNKNSSLKSVNLSQNLAQIQAMSEANASFFSFEKSTFGSLELALFLRAKAYEQVEFCGLVSHICVFHNAVLAFNAALNTRLILHQNATASFDENLEQNAINLLKAFWVEVV